jgi:branched-chain amino acid transport system ATP-binding protein
MKILELIGVSKYFGNSPILKQISFSLLEGEIFGIVGPNGAGKTTLVDVIAGLSPLSDGDIRFFGKSIRNLKAHKIGNLGISRTFDLAPPAAKMSALENVMVGALFGRSGKGKSEEAARRSATETLEFLGLSEKKDLPAGNLNVLERKWLEIGMALAMSPKLLLLDEVMSGLNSTEIDQGVELIKKIRGQGITILIVEHVMRTVTNTCNRMLVLHRGEKIAEGTPAHVLSQGPVIEAYLGKQYREIVN